VTKVFGILAVLKVKMLEIKRDREVIYNKLLNSSGLFGHWKVKLIRRRKHLERRGSFEELRRSPRRT